MTNIHPVGVNDRHKTLFEGLWPLPYGVSYNAYIIDDEKVALVDTVEVDFFSQFIDNVRRVIGDRPIDYIIVNHMEPDHSGSLALIKKYYPDAKIAGSFGLCAEALLYLDWCADEFEFHLCFVPLRNLLHHLACPCERAEDAEVMVLDAASG